MNNNDVARGVKPGKDPNFISDLEKHLKTKPIQPTVSTNTSPVTDVAQGALPPVKGDSTQLDAGVKQFRRPIAEEIAKTAGNVVGVVRNIPPNTTVDQLETERRKFTGVPKSGQEAPTSKQIPEQPTLSSSSSLSSKTKKLEVNPSKTTAKAVDTAASGRPPLEDVYDRLSEQSPRPKLPTDYNGMPAHDPDYAMKPGVSSSESPRSASEATLKARKQLREAIYSIGEYEKAIEKHIANIEKFIAAEEGTLGKIRDEVIGKIKTESENLWKAQRKLNEVKQQHAALYARLFDTAIDGQNPVPIYDIPKIQDPNYSTPLVFSGPTQKRLEQLRKNIESMEIEKNQYESMAARLEILNRQLQDGSAVYIKELAVCRVGSFKYAKVKEQLSNLQKELDDLMSPARQDYEKAQIHAENLNPTPVPVLRNTLNETIQKMAALNIKISNLKRDPKSELRDQEITRLEQEAFKLKTILLFGAKAEENIAHKNLEIDGLEKEARQFSARIAAFFKTEKSQLRIAKIEKLKNEISILNTYIQSQLNATQVQPEVERRGIEPSGVPELPYGKLPDYSEREQQSLADSSILKPMILNLGREQALPGISGGGKAEALIETNIIAESDHGKVIRATLPSGKVVIIKYANADLQADIRKEIELHQKIESHPNIVQCLGRSEDGGGIFEFIDAGELKAPLTRSSDLLSCLKQIEKLPEDQQKKIKQQLICDFYTGMAHLEKQGIIHRDLAARNLLVQEVKVVENGIAKLNYQLKIADFGLARFEGSDEADSGDKKMGHDGPLKWMAPESLEENRFNSKSDVYSFAIAVWEIISGEEPYKDKPAVTAHYQVVHEGLRPEFDKTQVNSRFIELMKECMDANPEKRPTFTELAEKAKSVPIFQ